MNLPRIASSKALRPGLLAGLASMLFAIAPSGYANGAAPVAASIPCA
jgi:hypothetical protein